MYISQVTSAVQPVHVYLFLASLISYRVAVTIYRIYFHPLAKIPGYKLAVSTRLYEYHYDSTCCGRYYVKLEQMHKDLGPIVRLNPYEVHINDPKFFHKLYNFDPAWSKDPAFVGSLDFKSNIEATVESGLHKKRRAPFDQFFSRKTIGEVEGLINQYVDKMCVAIEQGRASGKPVELHLLARAFTAEVICRYCFGKEYGFFEDLDSARALLVNIRRPGDLPYIHHIGRFSRIGIKITRFVGLMEFFTKKALGFKKDLGFQPFFEYASKLIASINEQTPQDDDNKPIAKEASSIGTPQRSIFHAIINSSLPETERSGQALFENAVLFLFAGFETTGFAMTLGLYYILRTPAVLERLRAELEATWPDPDWSSNAAAGPRPSWTELDSQPYLHAVVLESLRLSCGTLSRLARVSPVPVTYGDHVIPAGYPISMSSPLIHHNQTLFPDPHAFNPDRWLRGSAQEQRELRGFLTSFSAGSRGCIGRNLAMAEMHLGIAGVVRRFGGGMKLDPAVGEEHIVPWHDNFVPVPREGRQRLIVTFGA